jgi:hypothetical protein
MFASCSDDSTIRLWETPVTSGELFQGVSICESEPEVVGKGKVKVKNDGTL